MKHPEIRLTGLQIKSEAKARALAKALDIIEVECGIRVTRLTLERCFICPDIRWDRVKRTPMQRLVARIAARLSAPD